MIPVGFRCKGERAMISTQFIMNSVETQAVNILIERNLPPTLSNNPDAQVWLYFSARVMHV